MSQRFFISCHFERNEAKSRNLLTIILANIIVIPHLMRDLYNTKRSPIGVGDDKKLHKSLTNPPIHFVRFSSCEKNYFHHLTQYCHYLPPLHTHQSNHPYHCTIVGRIDDFHRSHELHIKSPVCHIFLSIFPEANIGGYTTHDCKCLRTIFYTCFD